MRASSAGARQRLRRALRAASRRQADTHQRLSHSITASPSMQRFFLAMHATTPAALIVTVFVHLWGLAGLPSLAQRPVWSLIGVWLLLSAAAAWALHTVALWRVSLGEAGALLAVAGVAGLVLGSAQGPAMFVSLVAMGLVFG